MYDGGSMTSPIIGEYCDTRLPPSRQIVSSNQLFFYFHSNVFGTSSGFKLVYNAISKNLGHFVSRAKKKLEFFKVWLVTYFDLPHFQFQNSKALCNYEVSTILFFRNHKNGQINTLLYLLFPRLNLIPLIFSCMYVIYLVFFLVSYVVYCS